MKIRNRQINKMAVFIAACVEASLACSLADRQVSMYFPFSTSRLSGLARKRYRRSEFTPRLESKRKLHHGFNTDGTDQAHSLEHNATLNALQAPRTLSHFPNSSFIFNTIHRVTLTWRGRAGVGVFFFPRQLILSPNSQDLK